MNSTNLNRTLKKDSPSGSKTPQFKSFSENADIYGVNIKNLIGSLAQITGPTAAAKVDRQIKTDNTQDRDANGQQLYQRERKKEKMTEEQFEKAVSLLREKHFIKDMHWVVLAAEENGLKYAWVQDQSGQTIRKISEFDLWEVFEDAKSEETKGQLLKKTA